MQKLVVVSHTVCTHVGGSNFFFLGGGALGARPLGYVMLDHAIDP